MAKFLSNVRFKVGDANRNALIKAFKSFDKTKYKGALSHQVIDCRDGRFSTTVVWRSRDDLVTVRPMLIRFLDSVRPLLELISPELGMTDPMSGEIIFEE